MMLCVPTINTISTEKSLGSKNGFSRYLQGAFALAAVRCGFLSVAETADLTQIHSLLQIADCQNQPRSSHLQIRESSKLRRATTVTDLRVVEGRVVKRYWEAFTKVLPEHLDFQGRMTANHQNNASDPVNLALNYGYGVLEGEVRKAINSVGLEPSVGFLHDLSDYQTRQSLVYDLQEPFRWLIDVSVVAAFESGTVQLHDFYFTGDDYRYRFEADAKQRFIDVMREQFNIGTGYKGRVLRWDTIIQNKTNELSRFLTGKSYKLDFLEPATNLNRQVNHELRAKILALTASQAKELCLGKSTLHYLRKNARTRQSFKIYSNVRTRLEYSSIRGDD
jgi:CRISPR-associated protein Cas1